MNDMRISNYEWYENIKLWKIWEYQIMKNMRMYNYERYENIYTYEIYIYIYIYFVSFWKIQENKYILKTKRCALIHWSFCVLNEIHTCLIWGVNNGNTEA